MSVNRFLSTIASLFLTMFFVGIMYYVMIEGVHILDSSNAVASMVFTALDSLILIVLVGLGKPISKAIGVGTFAPVTVATVIYTILAMGATLLMFGSASAFLFTLIKLILLFIFLCVVIPLAVVGKTTKTNEDTRPEIRKHNLD